MSQYGCHNRAPFKDHFLAQDGRDVWSSGVTGPRLIPIFVDVPFRMSPICNYTNTDLGQADARCHGCKHRKES